MTKLLTILCVVIDEGCPDYSTIQVDESHPLANIAHGEIDCDEDEELYELWSNFKSPTNTEDFPLPCTIDQVLTIYTY